MEAGAMHMTRASCECSVPSHHCPTCLDHHYFCVHHSPWPHPHTLSILHDLPRA